MKLYTPAELEIEFRHDNGSKKESFAMAMLARLSGVVDPLKVLRLVDGLDYFPEMMSVLLAFLFLFLRVPEYMSVIVTIVIFFAASLMNQRGIVCTPLPQIAAFFRPQRLFVRAVLVLTIIGEAVVRSDVLSFWYLLTVGIIILVEHTNYALIRLLSGLRKRRVGVDLGPNELYFIISYLHYAHKYDLSSALTVRKAEFESMRYRECLDAMVDYYMDSKSA